MKLNIKILSDNTLLEPGEIVLKELYTTKEKMDYDESTQSIQTMKYMLKGNYVHPSFIKFKRQESVVLNEQNVFDVVYNTGKVLFEKINAKYTIEDYLNNFAFINHKERLFFEDIYSKWIMDYGFPYQSGDKNTMGVFSFIWHCLTLYIFFYIHKLRSTYEISITKDPYIQLPKIINELNKFINLFKEHWFLYEDIYRTLYSNENNPFSKFEDFITYIKETSLQLNKIPDNKNYLSYIKKGMLFYINNLIKEEGREDFSFTSQNLFHHKKTDEYKKFDNCAVSLMSIAYDKLLNNLTSGSYDYEVKECKNPECDNYFSAYGNYQFCGEKCAKAVEKMRKHEYDKTHNRAEQAKLRRKHKKIFGELISLNDQYNIPKEFANKINHYIEKDKKSGISFHDVDIEKLYIEVKDYLKNKYNTLID